MFSALLDWIYPQKCGLCARFGADAICPSCLSEFSRCPELRAKCQAPLDFQGSLFLHESRAAQAVRRLKYSRITSLVHPLAGMIRDGYESLSEEEWEAVVPIPIHWSRRSSRGFNQAECLCSALPRDLVRPGLLRRIRRTRPQVGLDQAHRARNLRGAFRASSEVVGLRILLVDDVTTSGHTARECAQALKHAGAVSVGLLTLTAEI